MPTRTTSFPARTELPTPKAGAKTPPLYDGPTKKLELWRLEVAKAELLAEDSDDSSSTDDSSSDVDSAPKATIPTSARPPKVLSHCDKRRAQDKAAKE